VIERLLLDGVDAKAGAATIGRQHHFASDVLANKAETAVARFKMAFSGTKIANNATRLIGFMPPSTSIETVT
jgi:hypothetical protein